jgi:DNA-binding transcriptional ArsR family regulator
MMTNMEASARIPKPLPDPLVDAIAVRFRILGEPMRLRLLDRLRHGEASVGELAFELGASQQNISRHLNVLHAAGLVQRRKRGTRVLYAIGDQTVFALCETACGSLYETVSGLAELLEPTIHHEGTVR